MVKLVALAQAAQDRDGVLNRGLVDQHGLEPALERGVFLDVLAIFVEGGGANAMQLAASQHGLQQVSGIHGAFGLPGSHHGVQFINKQDDVALGALDLFQNGLEALLKLAAEFRTGDQRSHVERNHALIL